MSRRLLDRQVKLLDFLTSRAAIFDDPGVAAPHQALRGMNSALLCLEARFSHQKRLEKIAAVFPRTFEMLEGDLAVIIHEFVNSYPPVDIGRLANARQFYDFLCGRCQQVAALTSYLSDVAACELACARVRAGDRTLEIEQDGNPPQNGIRRNPRAVLVRCSYDVRPIFEGGSAKPARRETRIGVAIPRDAEKPQIFELFPPVFDFVSALDDWTDSAATAATPHLKELMRDLSNFGLIEVHP